MLQMFLAQVHLIRRGKCIAVKDYHGVWMLEATPLDRTSHLQRLSISDLINGEAVWPMVKQLMIDLVDYRRNDSPHYHQWHLDEVDLECATTVYNPLVQSAHSIIQMFPHTPSAHTHAVSECNFKKRSTASKHDWKDTGRFISFDQLPFESSRTVYLWF